MLPLNSTTLSDKDGANTPQRSLRRLLVFLLAEVAPPAFLDTEIDCADGSTMFDNRVVNLHMHK